MPRHLGHDDTSRGYRPEPILEIATFGQIAIALREGKLYAVGVGASVEYALYCGPRRGRKRGALYANVDGRRRVIGSDRCQVCGRTRAEHKEH